MASYPVVGEKRALVAPYSGERGYGTGTLCHRGSGYERASAASERVLTELGENPEYERPAGPPAGPPAGRGDALQKLIS